MAQENPKLIYFADPMCSWCYGFSPELTKVTEELGTSVDFQMVMGGLRPYNTETMTQLGDFLKGHWDEVHERSGQPFSFDILKDTDFVYDTEPACRAVVLMRRLKPEDTFAFFKAIQTAFYKENKSTNATATYIELLKDFDIEASAFQKAFESDEMKERVKEDFNYAATIGIRSFPTLVLQNGKDYYMIAAGYAKAELVLDKINKVLQPQGNN